MNSTYIKTDGTYKVVKPKNRKEFSLEELQNYVEGYIEIIRLSTTQIMVVNEEGKLKGLPINSLATVASRMTGRNDIIVGNVLICDSNLVK